MKIYHPNTDNNGKTVEIRHPNESTKIETWDEIDQLATVTPGAHMPVAVGEIEIQSWRDAPRDAAGWEKLATMVRIDEPAYKVTPGKQVASGAVVIEQDGRVWIVSPTNRHGGYQNTFPKGKLGLGEKLSLQANALKEVYEESSLKVELISFLCDSERDTSTTRLYLARRLTGNPADMGWESQAVHLVPRKALSKFVTHANDAGVLTALSKKAPLSATEAEVLKTSTLTSGYRIVATINGFRSRFGHWPIRISMDESMAAALAEHTFTSLGWAMLANKVQIMLNDAETVIAEGRNAERFEYDGYHPPPPGERSDVWIWGVAFVN